ncbi:GTPase [Candidatus Vidania fulgoroideorum]
MKETLIKYYKRIKKKSINNPIICLSTCSKHDSAIAIVRISLGNYEFILKKIIKTVTKKKYIFPRLATFTNFFCENKIIDKGILIYFPSPKSYNGETILEFHMHDNKYIIKKFIKYIIKKFKKYGIRISKRGEFTKRSFLNRKIDLIELRKIYDIINYKKKNKNFLFYNFKNDLEKITNIIYNIIINIENKINFNFKIKNFRKIIEKKICFLISEIKKKKKIFRYFYLEKKNINVTIIGNTNTGKSSLFNKILKYDRSIVSKKPGTTTDYISENVYYKDITFKLNDVVGKRKKMKKKEKKGLKISKKVLKNSDIFISLSKTKNKNSLLVKNKIDKCRKKIFMKKKIFISCKNNFGINILMKSLYKKIIKLKCQKDKSYFNINKIYEKIKKIKKDFVSYKIFYEEISFLLNEIYKKITNYFYYDRKIILNDIFKNFCVGK